jgi:hypothetical protein
VTVAAVPDYRKARPPGEAWSFQSWYRDQTPAGTPTSNFSTAVAVEIR